MPTLAQLSGSGASSANPTLITVQANNPVVEPLDGPTPVDDVMDRFAPEVYQQGRDSHLYRFLTALCGDSGAGFVKKLAFNARLILEGDQMFFQTVDQFFGGQFNLSRLQSETYPYDTTGTLTAEEWDEVLLADQSYKQRIVEYFTATRQGNSPGGLQMMAQAGTGIECDLVENYKWVFDQFSDDKLGLALLGTTASTSEFVIVPRFLNLSSDIYDQGYDQPVMSTQSITAASFPNARPALGGTSPSVSYSGQAPVVLYQNLVANGDFESGTTDWAVANSPSVVFTSDTTHAKFGTHSLKVTVPGTGTNLGVFTSLFATGTAYTASGWVFAPEGLAMDFIFQAYDISSFIGGDSIAFVGTGGWQYVTLTFSAPPTTTSLNLVVVVQNAVAATFWLDGIQVETGTVAHDFTNGIVYETQTELVPSIERSAIDLLDQLRPVGTLATIAPENTRFVNVPIVGDPSASSTRINVSRFITGKANVPWPQVGGNNFIQAGVENEAPYFYGSQRDLPVVFQTVESVHAYISEAEGDPNYGTTEFFDASSGISTFATYQSEFTGNYDRNLTAIFPFLLNLDPSNTYTAEQAIAAQNTPLVLEGRSAPSGDITPDDLLINGTYPQGYFTLPGVDPIQYPDSFWWGSRSRYAALNPSTGNSYLSAANGGLQTSEVLEIDLGRIREVNYINMDVLTAPINITIEYDDISTPDREAVWLPVTPMGNMPFDNRVAYNADSRTSWFNGEYNFTDDKGDMIHTRYLRITFTRRDELWPTNSNAPFPWPVLAKHLRIGRYIEQYLDTVGPLLVQDTPTDLTPIELVSINNLDTREARQQFVFPSDAARGDQIPNLLGFGVLVQTNTDSPPFDQTNTSPVVQFQWSVWDVTNASAPVQLRTGVETGVVTPGLSWLDFYLSEDQVIVGDESTIYELRISSITALAANTVFTHAPATLSTTAIPGTLDFVNGSTSVSTSVDTTAVVKIGQFIANSDVPDQVYTVNGVTASAITLNTPYAGINDSAASGYIIYPYSSYNESTDLYVTDGTQNLVIRVWADVADAGRDVLGNAYRYATRRALPQNVLDNTRPGWMSDPIPAPNGVEAMYFDVRSADPDNNPLYAYIDAVRIAPRTPGVQMNIYYSQQGLSGDAPSSETEWDYLLWQPVQASYVLRRSEIIQLPYQIKATFIKLEFTNLTPAPFRVPTFPALPPKQYRVFPQWVLDQFASSNTVDTFQQSQTLVSTQALDSLTDPVQEYNYGQRSLLSQLALGTVSDSQTVSAGISDVSGMAAVDPTTAQQIFLNTPSQYQNTQLISVDQNTILGKVVVSRFNPTLFTTPIEGTALATFLNSGPNYVSTTNDRLSQAYQGILQNGLRFNQLARHTYDVIEAQFNKKAYFVGIQEVQFLRNDYTVEHDDPVIDENVFNVDASFVVDTWQADADTSIPDGAVLYVSYSVNPTIVDEQVTLAGFVPVELATVGGPAFNVLVYDQPNKQGNQYFQGQDYDLQYGYDSQGNRTTSIVRSQLGNRLAVPLQAIIYVDAGIVVGHAVIPSEPTDDAAVVTSVGVPITTQEGPFVPDFGAGTFGGGTFGDLTKHVSDSGTVASVGKPSGVTSDQSTDSGTVVSVGVPSGTDTYTP